MRNWTVCKTVVLEMKNKAKFLKQKNLEKIEKLLGKNRIAKTDSERTIPF